MSTHVLDVAGGRPLSLTINDPARTSASVSAKAGEDVQATISGGREIRLELPANARVQIRSYPQRKLVYDENGKAQKDPDNSGAFIYEEGEPIEKMILVLQGSVSAFMRVSSELFAEDDPAKPTYEMTPHTNISVRRWKEEHFTESGSLVRELIVGKALLQAALGDADPSD